MTEIHYSWLHITKMSFTITIMHQTVVSDFTAQLLSAVKGLTPSRSNVTGINYWWSLRIAKPIYLACSHAGLQSQLTQWKAS